jgi:hypothetical protein
MLTHADISSDRVLHFQLVGRQVLADQPDSFTLLASEAYAELC